MDRYDDVANKSGNTDIDSNDSKSNTVNSGDISDTDTTIEKLPIFDDNTKRSSLRQRKVVFKEYRNLFLTTPKIEHRKPAFISEDMRERLDEIARNLGYKGMSASGFLGKYSYSSSQNI